METISLIPSVEFGQTISFLAGLLTGLAFVVASAVKWR